jgi:hypothetical protein
MARSTARSLHAQYRADVTSRTPSLQPRATLRTTTVQRNTYPALSPDQRYAGGVVRLMVVVAELGIVREEERRKSLEFECWAEIDLMVALQEEILGFSSWQRHIRENQCMAPSKGYWFNSTGTGLEVHCVTRLPHSTESRPMNSLRLPVPTAAAVLPRAYNATYANVTSLRCHVS